MACVLTLVVGCINTAVGLSTLQGILSMDRTYTDPLRREHVLPFINQNRKARVRVIDYFPSALEEFTRAGVLSPEESEGSDLDMGDSGLPRWEWDFLLLLEDASSNHDNSTIWVHVSNTSAQYLLKLDAVK